MDRRKFLTSSTSCGAHVLSLAVFAPALTRKVFSPQEKDKKNIVAEEPFGRLEKVHDGVWALISTPFTKARNFTTVCNGGIIAGSKGVLAIESFANPKGATWLANQAQKLAGSWPTDIVSTHYHGDHTGGHNGYYTDEQKPRYWLTEETQTAAEKSFTQRKMKDGKFKNVELIDAKKGATIDLGNREIKLVPRSGHTASDITVELVEPKVVWCGDLFFNRMFPNYTDATPSQLNEYVDEIFKAKDVTYIPGHGPLADLKAMKEYQELLALIQYKATTAYKAGKTIAEETKTFALPKTMNEWFIWSPQNATKAYQAWYNELDAKKAAKEKAAKEKADKEKAEQEKAAMEKSGEGKSDESTKMKDKDSTSSESKEKSGSGSGK